MAEVTIDRRLEISNPTHFILISEASVFTKTADFFTSQGGMTDDWGKNWRPITADSLYDARDKAIALRRQTWPDCHLTLGERPTDRPEIFWPEAKGQ